MDSVSIGDFCSRSLMQIWNDNILYFLFKLPLMLSRFSITPTGKEILMEKIILDGREYDLQNISEEAEAQVSNIQFVNEQILQRNNEMQIAQTAKIGYQRALKRELEKIESDA